MSRAEASTLQLATGCASTMSPPKVWSNTVVGPWHVFSGWDLNLAGILSGASSGRCLEMIAQHKC
eukprot:3580176-Amphidinium_carterae.1